MATPILSSSVAAQAREDLNRSRAEHLLHDIGSKDIQKTDSRIEKGAREFEAILLNNWLQQAEQSMATVPGANDDQGSSGGEQMASFGVQSLATAMAASGGIGIADMIEKALRAEADRGQPEPPAKDGTQKSLEIHG